MAKVTVSGLLKPYERPAWDVFTRKMPAYAGAATDVSALSSSVGSTRAKLNLGYGAIGPARTSAIYSRARPSRVRGSYRPRLFHCAIPSN